MSRLHWRLGLLATVVAGVCNGLGVPHGPAWALGVAWAAAAGLAVSLARPRSGR